MSRKSAKADEKAEAANELRKLLKPGDTVYTVLRHVSGSGMSRRIDLYVIRDGAPRYLSGYVGRALEYRRHKDGGLVVGGCGMDMGFHLVYKLGATLWQTLAGADTAAGRALRKRMAKARTCRSYLTQGGGEMPDPNKPEGSWQGAAGYALSHEWL